MIFTNFTAVVFVAEIIITVSILSKLIQLDKWILSTNDLITEANPKIKDVCELCHGISSQIAELAPVFVENLKELRNKIVLTKIKGLIALILFWSINIRVIKKFRKSKIIKAAIKGLSLLENMV